MDVGFRVVLAPGWRATHPTEHWLFDCCLPVAREQRTGLIARLDEVNFSLAVLDGGRQHEATANALAVLRGQGGGEAEKRQRAFRWLVGCIPKPRVSNKTVRKMVMQAVSAGGRSLHNHRTGPPRPSGDREIVGRMEHISKGVGWRGVQPEWCMRCSSASTCTALALTVRHASTRQERYASCTKLS